mgnify:CR=1 FL=1
MDLPPFNRPRRPIEKLVFTPIPRPKPWPKHGTLKGYQPAPIPAPEPPPPDSPPPEPGPDIPQHLVRHFNRLLDHASGQTSLSTTYPKLAKIFGLRTRHTIIVMADLEVLNLVRKVSSCPGVGCTWEIMHSAHIITSESSLLLTNSLRGIMTCTGCTNSTHHEHDSTIINALHSLGFRDAPKILAKVGAGLLLKTLRGIESTAQAGKYVRNVGGFLRWCLTHHIIPQVRERLERVRRHIEHKITRLDYWTKRAKEIGYDAAMAEMRAAAALPVPAG